MPLSFAVMNQTKIAKENVTIHIKKKKFCLSVDGQTLKTGWCARFS